MFYLISARLRIFKNRINHHSLKNKLIEILTILLLIITIFGINILIIKLFKLETFQFKNILYIVFPFLFIIGLSKQIFDVFNIFFESSDRDLLFCTPISTKAIISYRTFQILFSSLSIYFILFVPFVFSYGIIVNVHFMFFIVSILSLLSFMMIVVSIIQIFVLIIIRYAPKSYKKETIYFIMGLLSLITFIFIVFMPDLSLSDNPWKITKVFELLLTPFIWFVNSISSIVNGNYILGYKYTIYLTILSIIICTLSIMLMEKFFCLGWFIDYDKNRNFISKNRKKLNRNDKMIMKNSLLYRYPILAKDLKCFIRDISKWKFILFPVMLLMLYSKKYDYSSNLVQYAFNLYIFTIYTAIGISFNSITYEGDCYYLLKTSAISFRNLFASKFLNSVILTTVFIQLINLIIILIYRINLIYSLLVSIGCIMIILIVCAMSNYYGLKYLFIDENKLNINPLGYLISVSISFGYILSISFLSLISYMFFYSNGISGMFGANYIWLKTIIGFGFALSTVFICYRLIKRTFTKVDLLQYPE